jgi:hypothetical protein
MPAACAFTSVELLTAYVAVNPSALLTVMDDELTFVTEPLWTSTVW